MSVSPRILVVIQDRDERTLIELLLRRHGFSVDLAEDSSEARPLADDAPALVIWDSNSPEEELQAFLVRLPVAPERLLLLTTRDALSLQRQLGITCLQKPVDVGLFLECVDAQVGMSSSSTADPAAAVSPPELELVLYIHGGTATGLRAQQHLEQALGRYGAENVHLTVVDVAAPAATGDAFMLTPSLLRCRPTPRQRLLGDLSDEETLHHWLAASGLVAPTPMSVRAD